MYPRPVRSRTTAPDIAFYRTWGIGLADFWWPCGQQSCRGMLLHGCILFVFFQFLAHLDTGVESSIIVVHS